MKSESQKVHYTHVHAIKQTHPGYYKPKTVIIFIFWSHSVLSFLYFSCRCCVHSVTFIISSADKRKWPSAQRKWWVFVAVVCMCSVFIFFPGLIYLVCLYISILYILGYFPMDFYMCFPFNILLSSTANRHKKVNPKNYILLHLESQGYRTFLFLCVSSVSELHR